MKLLASFKAVTLAFAVTALPVWADSVPLVDPTELVAEQIFAADPTIPGDADITLTPPLDNAAPAMGVSDFRFDRASHRYTGNLQARDGQLTPITGMALITRKIPVPASPIEAGHIMTAADLQTETLPLERVSKNTIDDATAIIGLQAKRDLRAGMPILPTFLVQPILVARGAGVSITYADGALSLRAPGKALANGVKDAQIPVINLESQKTVNAIVTGVNEVTIFAPTQQIPAQENGQ